MFAFFTDWWHRRIIKKSTITETLWREAFKQLPILDKLTDGERKRLKHVAILLLHKKSFTGAQGLRLTDGMKLLIALQAGLPVLNLGIEWYRGWVSIIVYPESFIPQRAVTDEAGVVHQSQAVLSGESWQRGPVILAWDEVASAGVEDGSNLVIHEFVHKLDMLNGVANGFPPLHVGMDTRSWSHSFSAAYQDLSDRINAGENTVIDDYAATSPAEFFAVLSEVFFEKPGQVLSEYPQVYSHMLDFFRQDPLRHK